MPEHDETQCEHREVVEEPRGGFSLTGGTISDDVETVLFCLDCLVELDPVDVPWDVEINSF